MRKVRFIGGDITTEIPDLNVNYKLIFTHLDVKGEVFGCGVDYKGKGIAVKMMVDRKYTIRSLIIECWPLNAALSSYMSKTNGNAFVVVDPKKEKWFKKMLNNKGCEAQDVLEEECHSYSGP